MSVVLMEAGEEFNSETGFFGLSEVRGAQQGCKLAQSPQAPLCHGNQDNYPDNECILSHIVKMISLQYE